MDVNELVGLSRWMVRHVNPAMPAYEQLTAAMEQNATNGSKVPLRESLELAKRALLEMPVSQLNYQQTDLLENMQVENFLGGKGWRFVERTVKEGNYDPASAATDIRSAKQRIENCLALFTQAGQSLIGIGIQGEPEFGGSDKVTIRVRFKEGVEIANIAQLRGQSAEWYDISRGLVMAAGERPEDVEVKGASTGSLIFILGTSLTVATIIALIMKQVASTVKSTMEIAHILQDWKMRKIADSEVESVLLTRRKRIEDDGVDAALALVKEKLGARIAGDAENALKKSIEKMFSFAAKGGEVDMLAPPKPSEDVDHEVAEAINTIAQNVEEMRTLKAATQLLIEVKANGEPESNTTESDATD